MKTHEEILNEINEGTHDMDASYFDEYRFDGDMQHVKQAMNLYALQFLDAVRKQVDDQCGNEYRSLTFIDELKQSLTN